LRREARERLGDLPVGGMNESEGHGIT
jgi:hypothetical protein